MRDRPNQELRGFAWQYGVGVQGDDIADQVQSARVADDGAECVTCFAAQVFVELREFPALAFPTHPHVLLRIPKPRSMEEEEHILVASSVFAVQGFDARRRDRKSTRLNSS